MSFLKWSDSGHRKTVTEKPPHRPTCYSFLGFLLLYRHQHSWCLQFVGADSHAGRLRYVAQAMARYACWHWSWITGMPVENTQTDELKWWQRSFPSSQSPTEDTVTFFSTGIKWSVRGNSSISYFNRSVCTIMCAYSTWLATAVFKTKVLT